MIAPFFHMQKRARDVDGQYYYPYRERDCERELTQVEPGEHTAGVTTHVIQPGWVKANLTRKKCWNRSLNVVDK